MASSDGDETTSSRASSFEGRSLFKDTAKVSRHPRDRQRLIRLTSVCTTFLAISLIVIYLHMQKLYPLQDTKAKDELMMEDGQPVEWKFHEAPSISRVEPGDILTTKFPIIASADRSHYLVLQRDGNLALYQSTQSGDHIWNRQNHTKLIWTLGTGNIESGTTNVLRLTEDGVLYMIQEFRRKEDGKVKIDEQWLWHSNLIPDCKTPSDAVVATKPKFEIGGNGELIIHGRCKIYSPPRKTVGKLAVLVSGLYRSNGLVCRSQVDHLGKHPLADSVDIFAYILYEEDDLRDDQTVEDIETTIRECYGHFLQKLTLKSVDEVAEEFPDKVDNNCGRLHRLQSQLKTLYLNGLDWWQWSVTNGVKHDTVIRVRTDHEFWGLPPTLKTLDQLEGNELVLTPIAGGSPVPTRNHWFCSNPYGRMDIAISDQIAYGTPTAMRYYLMMYQDFRFVVAMSVPANKAYRENWLCLDMPRGPMRDECANVEFCTIECVLSWYLQSWGIKMSITWSWEFAVKR